MESELNTKGKKILLVEDDKNHAELLSRWLENDGRFEVSVVNDGLLGTHLSQKSDWNLIISDINLPRKNGFELVKMCKTLNPHIPVLLITGQDSIEYALQAIQNRADDLLIKPFTRTEIVEKANQLIANAVEKEPNETLTVLAIGTRPYDVELGCGATLHNHNKNGDNVNILNLNYGGVDKKEQHERQRESESAARLLDARLFWAGLPEAEISDGIETVRAIEKVIKKINPDIIYTHTIQDSRTDHKNTHIATIAAAANVSNVFCYQGYSSTTDFKPSFFNDISDSVRDKLYLVSHFDNRAGKCKYMAPDLIESTAKYWGRFAEYNMVEPFEVVRKSE
jgi:CheY-like chemotaxis protein/LmbE family N-acetylglucosaminyl deacetylase